MRPPDFSVWTVHVVIVVLNAMDTFAGDLRCYCNLPRCIAKGYMCKSSATGQCFFMLQRRRVTVQGCTDLLPTHRQSCDYNLQAPVAGLLPLVRASEPAVVCCAKHMCNHDDYAQQLEARIEASEKNRTGTPAPPRYWYMPNWRSTGISEQEVWLKAAVIGVPIAGGFIMMVLLFIAVRILRQDSKLRRKPLHGAGDILVAHSASAAAAAAAACANGARETRRGGGGNGSGAWLLKHTGSIV